MSTTVRRYKLGRFLDRLDDLLSRSGHRVSSSVGSTIASTKLSGAPRFEDVCEVRRSAKSGGDASRSERMPVERRRRERDRMSLLCDETHGASLRTHTHTHRPRCSQQNEAIDVCLYVSLSMRVEEAMNVKEWIVMCDVC